MVRFALENIMTQTLEEKHSKLDRQEAEASLAKAEAFNEYMKTIPKSDEWHAARNKFSDAFDAHEKLYVAWKKAWEEYEASWETE